MSRREGLTVAHCLRQHTLIHVESANSKVSEGIRMCSLYRMCSVMSKDACLEKD